MSDNYAYVRRNSNKGGKSLFFATFLVILFLSFAITNCAWADPLFPVYCNGSLIGIISAHLQGSGVVADFSTAGTGFTLQGAATFNGEDHFNWVQFVIADNHPPVDNGGNPLVPPYIDPPPGGYGGDDPQWADNLPGYYDVTQPPPGTLGFHPTLLLSAHTFEFDLTFSDYPTDVAGTNLSFETFLDSEDPSGDVMDIYPVGFSWDWTNPPGSAENLEQVRRVPEPSTASFLIVGLLIVYGIGRGPKQPT